MSKEIYFLAGHNFHVKLTCMGDEGDDQHKEKLLNSFSSPCPMPIITIMTIVH
jgi:hypothetical protein